MGDPEAKNSSDDEVNEYQYINQLVLNKTTTKDKEAYINKKCQTYYLDEFDRQFEPNANRTLNDLTRSSDNFNLPDTPEEINAEKKSENIEDSSLKKDKNIFLIKKVKRNETDTDINRKEVSKKLREDIIRTCIGRHFFSFLIDLIVKMQQQCNCILYLQKFPRDLILHAAEKSNKHYLEYTLEELFENKQLYENKDPFDVYSMNLKVIHELKSEKNKKIMEMFGYDKILKMKYRELYELLYSKSNEYKQHKQQTFELYEKKGIKEKEKIDLWFDNFIERYKK